VGGVVDGEHPVEPGLGPGGEGVVAAEQQHPVRPRRVDQPAAALFPVPDQPLPHPGQHQVGQLDEVEPVDRDQRVRQLLGDGLAARRRRVDRDDLDPVPPRRAAGGQPAADRGGVAAVDDTQYLAAVSVHDRRHPRLDPPPAAVLVSVPADPPVAVLIDPDPAHVQVVDIRPAAPPRR